MRVRGWLGVFGGGLMAAVAAPVVAHHSFAAEFDINRPIKLEGVVTRMQFSNPHSWLHIEVTTASGEKQAWAVEGGAPNALIRHGWNRNSVPAGTKVRWDVADLGEHGVVRLKSDLMAGEAVRVATHADLTAGIPCAARAS